MLTEDIISTIFLAFFIFALGYLIFKRIEDKKKEDFEDREN